MTLSIVLGAIVFLVVFLDCSSLVDEASEVRRIGDMGGGITAFCFTSIGGVVAFALLATFDRVSLGGSIVWVKAYPYHILLGIVGYFAIGVVWSFCFVPRFVRDRYRRLRALKAEWDSGVADTGKYETFQEFLDDTMPHGVRTANDVPEFREYGYLVGRRIAWWWAYVINWALSEVLGNLASWLGPAGEWIAARFRGVYDALARAAISSVTKMPRE